MEAAIEQAIDLFEKWGPRGSLLGAVSRAVEAQGLEQVPHADSYVLAGAQDELAKRDRSRVPFNQGGRVDG